MKNVSLIAVATAAWILALPPAAEAAPISIVNFGFEDTAGQNSFNEFTFGQPTGWDFYDPDSIIAGGQGSNGIFTGTLLPNGTEFFNATAPEGDRVGILFGFCDPVVGCTNLSAGAGEYGLQQTLTTALEANTQYELSVEVGNIASGITFDSTFFNLDGFPGYRVELLAGGTVIALDDSSLVIPEGEFATANISFTTGQTHALLGQSIGIRLVNLNLPMAPNDIEVDFDNVILNASAISAVPIPATLSLFLPGLLGLGLMAKRRRKNPPA